MHWIKTEVKMQKESISSISCVVIRVRVLGPSLAWAAWLACHHWELLRPQHWPGLPGHWTLGAREGRTRNFTSCAAGSLCHYPIVLSQTRCEGSLLVLLGCYDSSIYLLILRGPCDCLTSTFHNTGIRTFLTKHTWDFDIHKKISSETCFRCVVPVFSFPKKNWTHR